MPRQPRTRKTGNIFLYYKQGDDMNHCLSYFPHNGLPSEHKRLDIQTTFNKKIAHLQSAIDTLTEIKNNISPIEDVDIDADTHYIGLTASNELVDLLASKDLISIYENEDEDEDEYESDEEDDDNDNCDDEEEDDDEDNSTEINT